MFKKGQNVESQKNYRFPKVISTATPRVVEIPDFVAYDYAFNNHSRVLITLEKTTLKKNIVEKGENDGNWHSLLFPQCFSSIKDKFRRFSHFNMSSIDVFNLYQATILCRLLRDLTAQVLHVNEHFWKTVRICYQQLQNCFTKVTLDLRSDFTIFSVGI